jgi:hypothetical protein
MCCERNGAESQADVQQTTCDGEHATGKMQQTTRSVQHTTSRQHAPCRGQYAANNNDVQRASKQHATDRRKRGKDNGQRATDNRKQGKRQQGNMWNAADTAQKTANDRQRMQQTTCIRQLTACKKTRAHARCIRKHTALPHFVCGKQRAAHN